MASGVFLIAGSSISIPVESNTCSAALVAVNAYHMVYTPRYVAEACSSDPVVPRTRLTMRDTKTVNSVLNWDISAITATAPDSGLVVKPFVASPDDYAAVAVIFGVILSAACLIWGLKQILRLLRTSSEA